MSFGSQDQTCTIIRDKSTEDASFPGPARNETRSLGPYDSNAEPSFVFHRETPSVGESTPLFQASKETGIALGPGPCHAQRMSCSGRENKQSLLYSSVRVPLNRDNGLAPILLDWSIHKNTVPPAVYVTSRA